MQPVVTMPPRTNPLPLAAWMFLLLLPVWSCGEASYRFPACPPGTQGRFGECLPAPSTNDPQAEEALDAPLEVADLAPDPVDTATDPSEPDHGLDLADTSVPEDLAPNPDADAGPPEEPPPDIDVSPCPTDMVLVSSVCMDRYEAPNRAGALPLVMYTYYEARDWCEARDKRLCYDDEWTFACAGSQGYAYPYGNVHDPGVCNDEEIWRLYDQPLLNGWPLSASAPDIDSLEALLEAARSTSAAGTLAADHIEWLYQGEPSGENTGCGGEFGVFDLVGNVEEWTRRRDGGSGPDFSGNLKGRYWAESRTCQSGVLGHGNAFRFYEIGFRCCREPGPDPG